MVPGFYFPEQINIPFISNHRPLAIHEGDFFIIFKENGTKIYYELENGSMYIKGHTKKGFEKGYSEILKTLEKLVQKNPNKQVLFGN